MIKVQNIYYMLAYAYQTLNSQEEKKYNSEKFDYVDDLFAAILANGISRQLKQGLGREYIVRTEELKSPKGKLCLTDTIKRQITHSKVAVCQVDDYIENTYLNQILKATANLLLRSPNVKLENKRKLKRILLYFSDVDFIEYSQIRWSIVRYNRNNQSYKMLMDICYLVIEGMLISDKKGNYKLNEFIDDQRMSALYEKFILTYYRRHYPGMKSIAPTRIDWDTEDEFVDLLPQMKSDIMIIHGGYTLIIDAKYYGSSLQVGQYGKKTIHSHNLYQIFTYVKNRDRKKDGTVSGMLLYANTDGDNPDQEYHFSGNTISVKTLDLNCNFENVKSQLDNIVDQWMKENNIKCERIN